MCQPQSVPKPEKRRFDFSGATVGPPLVGESVVPDERVRRQAVDEHLKTFLDIPESKRRQRRRAAEKRYGVRPDDQVTTDAVAGVEQVDQDWNVRWVLAEQDGGVVARSVLVEPASRVTPPGGVTADMLRQLSPSTAAATGGTEAARRGDEPAWSDLLANMAGRRDEMGPRQPRRKSPGRPRLDDDILRRVAIAYLAEVKLGRGVLARMSLRFKRPEPTIRDWIRAARREGFLMPATKPGRREAKPGPRLLDSPQPEETAR